MKLAKNRKFISDLLKKTAIAAVGATAFRRQGEGAVKRMQRYLEKLSFSGIRRLSSETAFQRWLDTRTKVLTRRGRVRWGTARKALNLFLRDCLYNRYLCRRFQIGHIEKWMEMPLDKAVVAGKKGLRKSAGRGRLPPWKGLKRLRKKNSNKFQAYAKKLARDEGMARVHLDVGMWVENR